MVSPRLTAFSIFFLVDTLLPPTITVFVQMEVAPNTKAKSTDKIF
jgi:hypothetical protein